MADDELIEFVIDGSAERHGAIPAEAFIAKLRAFITTIYAFERAFTRKDKRQLELEIVGLERRSPARVKFRPRAKAHGYETDPALEWTFGELQKLYNGQPVDPDIPQEAIDNVVDLAGVRSAKLPTLGVMQAKFGAHIIRIDETLESRARALRTIQRVSTAAPWQAGISRGELFGELRGVMDFDGERRFYIVPPSGPLRVQCVFQEELRSKMQEHLFQTVRATGFLHYDGKSPFPHLLEADKLDGAPAPAKTLRELRGLFKGVELGDADGWTP